MLTTLIFLIVLAVLIFVHELGHFLLARLFKIRVDAFKIGFGPKIFAWKRGETEYGLNLVPFGGYVKIHGENPDEDSTTGPDAGRSMVNKNRFQQALVLVAGISFNIIFAWILYAGLFMYGVTASGGQYAEYAKYTTNERIMIVDVAKDSPAATAGLKTGDVLIGVSSAGIVPPKATTTTGIALIQATVAESPVVIVTYDRQGEQKSVYVTPAYSSSTQTRIMGIAMNEVSDLKLPFFTALVESVRYTGVTVKNTVVGLVDFALQAFHGKADLSQVTGPVGIAGYVGDAARLGVTYLLMITALISINLAVINLLPFPALDGGRLFFLFIETIIRRRLPVVFSNWANAIGFILLIILMIVVTFRDVVKMF
jgi:regulator of sigma E protease